MPASGISRAGFISKCSRFRLAVRRTGSGRRASPSRNGKDFRGLTSSDCSRPRRLSASDRGAEPNQGLRDHAAIAVLLGLGLRVSELLNLELRQYTGRGFQKLLAKGGRIRDFVPVESRRAPSS